MSLWVDKLRQKSNEKSDALGIEEYPAASYGECVRLCRFKAVTTNSLLNSERLDALLATTRISCFSGFASQDARRLAYPSSTASRILRARSFRLKGFWTK